MMERKHIHVGKRSLGAIQSFHKAVEKAEKAFRDNASVDLAPNAIENVLANAYMKRSAACAHALAKRERRAPVIERFQKMAEATFNAAWPVMRFIVHLNEDGSWSSMKHVSPYVWRQAKT